MGETVTATLSRHDGPAQRDDAETRRWVARAWRPDDTATRSWLLTLAQNRVAEITGPDAPGSDEGWQPVHSVVASFTMTLLDILMHADDLATPQIAPTPEGGLNVEWLVGGDALSLTADLSGLSIIAQRDNDEHAFPSFYWEFGDEIEPLKSALVIAAGFLEKISTGIQHRLPTR
jgi:hypothetical protein